MSSKRSLIWDHFTAGANDLKAKCNQCSELVSRGGKERKNFTTTAMMNHLKNKHGAKYGEFKDKSTKAVFVFLFKVLLFFIESVLFSK